MLGLIILVSVLARGLLVRPPVGDDLGWLTTSAHFGSKERLDLPSIRYSRPLFRLLLYSWMSIVGDELSKTPILTNGLVVLSMMLIAICGYLAAGETGALVATTLYGFHPICLANDSYCLPDALAVPLLLSSVLCVLCYLRHMRMVYYLFACFLAGLTYAVKEYFLLIALPIIGLSCTRAHLRKIGLGKLLSAGAIALTAGITIQPALNIFDQGTAYDSYRSILEYPKLLIELKFSNPRTTGTSVTNPLWRFEYINWLLFYNGMAVALTFTAVLLALGRGRWLVRWDVAFFIAAMVTFMLFLMFAPVSLFPLMFVEMQRRYLTVVIPFWALALAVVYSSSRVLTRRFQRCVLFLALVGYAVSGVNDADNRLSWVHGVVLPAEGLRECLKTAQLRDIDTIVVTQYFRWRVPKQWMHGSPAIIMLPREIDDDVVQSVIKTSALRRVGVYIARENVKVLQRKAVSEHISYFEIADPADRPLLDAVLASGWQLTPIFVPHRASSQRIGGWYSRRSSQLLVGYLFHPKAN